MPNLASVLKEEVARIARKQVRAEAEGLKKALATQRADIVLLKQRLRELETALRRGQKAAAKAAPAARDDEANSTLRFSAKGLASNRRRLGLSAEDCGMLLGATGQSVYKWESGKARPRAKQLPAIAALRGMGKKEATARLESLRGKT